MEPVMVMLFPLVMYDNSAYREVEEKRRRKSRQAVEFRGMGKRKEKIVFILFHNRRMGGGWCQVFVFFRETLNKAKFSNFSLC